MFHWRIVKKKIMTRNKALGDGSEFKLVVNVTVTWMHSS